MHVVFDTMSNRHNHATSGPHDGRTVKFVCFSYATPDQSRTVAPAIKGLFFPKVDEIQIRSCVL
jgi:hypothetical protein